MRDPNLPRFAMYLLRRGPSFSLLYARHEITTELLRPPRGHSGRGVPSSSFFSNESSAEGLYAARLDGNRIWASEERVVLKRC